MPTTFESPALTKPAATAVTLTYDGWLSSQASANPTKNGITQTVTVPGVLADETRQLIHPCPSTANQSDYISAGIRLSAQGDNTLTFTADYAPTIDIMVYVAITEVDYAV